MMERNEFIDHSVGQPVLKIKANVSHDYAYPVGQHVQMDRMSETEEKLAFIQRVKQARMARFETQAPMLTILELDQGTYKQYETRTPLPHRHIPKFCAATGVSMEWLLTESACSIVQKALARVGVHMAEPTVVAIWARAAAAGPSPGRDALRALWDRRVMANSPK